MFNNLKVFLVYSQARLAILSAENVNSRLDVINVADYSNYFCKLLAHKQYSQVTPSQVVRLMSMTGWTRCVFLINITYVKGIHKLLYCFYTVARSKVQLKLIKVFERVTRGEAEYCLLCLWVFLRHPFRIHLCDGSLLSRNVNLS